MSGSSSSGPAELPARPEPIGLTVHSLPQADASALERRTASGRLKMLLILLICAAPVIASYFMYFVVRPQSRSHYADLIQPTRGIPATLGMTTLAGQPLAAQAFKRQWLLVAVGSAACDAACEQHLYFQRQLHLMLGRDASRVDKVWFVVGDGEPKAELIRGLTAGGHAVRVVRVGREALAQWLQPAAGESLEAHLYIVDPMGEWMMRAPARPDPSKLKRDLERLLRASSWWQQGRE